MVTISTDSSCIDWNATGNSKKAQNIRNLLNLYKYEVPYMREEGRDPGNIDSNVTKTRYKLIEETYDIISKYAPGTIIKSVDVINTTDGPVIKAVVEFE